MKGKGIHSEYLLTKLFSMDYFHYYSKPLLFAAYFFPFIALDTEVTRAYTPSEFNKKIENIKNNRHGNYYNFATQGFGNTPFFEPDISYSYFYSRLCSYDIEKDIYFNVKAGSCDTMECDLVKKDLRYVLKEGTLMLKRGKKVPEKVKETLLYELETSEVKDVLAKLLYYIISPNHSLPDVSSEKNQALITKLNMQFRITPNICIDFRKKFDENINVISNRIRAAKEIQVCCFDGISLFGDNKITSNIQQNIINTLSECANNNSGFNFELILSEYRYGYFEDTAKYQINIPHLRCKKKELPFETVLRLKKIKKAFSIQNFEIKLTRCSLPFALFIMKFDDESLDYVKVDIYSPMIDDNKDRPCFYVFKQTDPLLFQYFAITFEKMWKNDDYSYFIEEEDDLYK